MLRLLVWSAEIRVLRGVRGDAVGRLLGVGSIGLSHFWLSGFRACDCWVSLSVRSYAVHAVGRVCVWTRALISLYVCSCTIIVVGDFPVAAEQSYCANKA